jgi:hypothetical protein
MPVVQRLGIQGFDDAKTVLIEATIASFDRQLQQFVRRLLNRPRMSSFISRGTEAQARLKSSCTPETSPASPRIQIAGKIVNPEVLRKIEKGFLSHYLANLRK